ncbi:MAG: hypothetical protein WC521_08650 [Bdellovibrionales bacterium]
MSKNNFSRCFFLLAPLFIAVALWLVSSCPALADIIKEDPPAAETFGEVLCHAFINARSFGFIFELVAYCAGVLAALKGVYHLKLHADNPASNKLGVGLMYLFGSMGLLALPDVISTLEQSIVGYTAKTSGGGSGLVCGNIGPVSAAEGLDQVVTNFVLNFKEPLTNVASLVAILAGLFMIVNGLIKASKYGTDPKTYSMHSILTNLGFGAILMTIGEMLPMMVHTVFGTEEISKSDTLQWDKLGALIGGDGVSEKFIMAVNSALTFVQVIGAIAFVRGWLILKKVVEGSGNVSLAQGLTHILGGVLAINIFGFLRIMDKTFGINLFN